VAKFKYKALDGNGHTVSGVLETDTYEAAVRSLLSRRLEVFQIGEVSQKTNFYILNKRVKHNDLARYVRQLATLLSEKHLPALPRYVPRLAELGESTGQSAKALSDAAERMEYEESMRSEIRTALSYPMFLMVIGGVIVFLLFLFVVPRFDALIGNNRDNLPTISKVVMGVGAGLKENVVSVLAIMFGGVIGGAYVVRNQNLRERLRSVVENTPIIGPILTQADLGGWSRTIGIALDNGADLLSALKLGEFSIQSKRLRSRLQDARTEIRAGRNIDDVLQENIPDFDPLTIDLIRTGRASGSLADMLLFVGKTQENETREMTKRVAALAEPVAILGIALIVGTIVISIVLAMTSLYDFAV